MLCFISWCIIAGWRGDVGIIAEGALESETGYFLFTTVTPWLLYIIIFIMLVLQLQNRININWPLAVGINLCLCYNLCDFPDMKGCLTYSCFCGLCDIYFLFFLIISSKAMAS